MNAPLVDFLIRFRERERANAEEAASAIADRSQAADPWHSSGESSEFDPPSPPRHLAMGHRDRLRFR
jgi:hypothetical protein